MGLLPEIKSSPTLDPSKMTYLIYGSSGVGKTTFCAKLDSTLFLDTEEGTRLQNVFKVDIPTWEVFVKSVDEICAKKHAFKTIVIDTIGRLILSCTRYCCNKFAITHPSDVEFGKAYDVIKKTFDEPIHKLQHSGYGLWMVAHSVNKMVKPPIGNEYEFIEPDMPNFLKKAVLALCDFIFYATVEAKSETVEGKLRVINARVIKTKPTKGYIAKDRIVNSPLPETISLDTKEFLEELNKQLKLNSEIAVNG